MLLYNCRKTRTLKPQQKGKVKIMVATFTVEQMINDRGNGAMNQFVLRGDNKIIFQSYDSTIAIVDRDDNTVTIFPDWDYSVTTGKHRNIFFRDYAYISDLASKKGIEKALKDGICGRWKVVKSA